MVESKNPLAQLSMVIDHHVCTRFRQKIIFLVTVLVVVGELFLFSLKFENFSSLTLHASNFELGNQSLLQSEYHLLMPASRVCVDISRFSYPDPDWIRIQSGQWIRIQEGKNDPQK
jgi:hypothetical protein